MLDFAAIEAVRTWRYEPSVVDAQPRRVQLVEVIEFFVDDGARSRGYIALASDRRQSAPLRVFAVSQLLLLPEKQHKAAAKALQRLAKEPDQAVASAAKAGLAKLSVDSR